MLPILLCPGEVNALAHDLQRSIKVFPHKEGAQEGMARNDLLPGLLEGYYEEVSMQGASYLLEVNLRMWLVKAVEEHALLHW